MKQGNSRTTDPRWKQMTIRTPEGVVFALLIATPVQRYLALIVDMAAITVISSVLGTVLKIFSLVSSDLAVGLSIVFGFICQIMYPICMEWFWKGRTLGKWLMGLQVMDVQGLKLQASQIVIRNILRFIDILPAVYLLGGVSAFISRKGQRLGDIAANTIVIYHPPVTAPDLSIIEISKYNTFREYPHLAARLRQSVMPLEAQAVLSALIRRQNIAVKERGSLFESIRRHFENKVTFPAEAVEGLSDEQYVRNLADILYQDHMR
jgi:uncharacterized RDD family membrane protein YckC